MTKDTLGMFETPNNQNQINTLNEQHEVSVNW